ncbi:polysaccharide deacetylase family protein [Nonomuraea soli]|uniref:Peptidoglycan/xylan/chitin deacetylase (PgdA/CDA1 family) n=1 Tax=Nonomuraea soli TaxID=1032476 RepID=A0A7W0CUC3_9ACTN|nr:polysaccharide deacetylase family protein [Nonomuraea soli]MBA2897320.1 peptidoglycan/xylan/chitin deacetylase (PgdA/CDA1 family) [Nonomuraea soli]
MHKSRFFGGIALAASCLAGCGVATASPDQDAPVPADPTKISFVDPATVPGLTTRSLSEGESGGRYIHASYPAFADTPEFNQELEKEARRQVGEFQRETRGTTAPAKPEINMDWQLPVVSDSVIAVRLRTGVFYGANWGDSTKTLWFDRKDRRLRGLVQDDQGVRRAVLARFTERGITTLPNDVGFDSLTFNPDGDLVVEFDECEVADCSQGRVAVAVPKEQARPLLTATGRRAQDAAAQPVRQSPPLSPEPTETTEPAETTGTTEHTEPPTKPTETTGTTEPTGTTELMGATAATGTGTSTTDCSIAKCVALTFDDGPGPYTPELLDQLARAHARATFFTVGLNVAADPQVVRRMVREGHVVANHSWSHRDLSKLSSSRVADSLTRTQDTLAAATGERPTLVRPPYGAIGKEVQTVSQRMGLALVNWSVDTQDGQYRDPTEVAQKAVGGARPGAIILMHDIHRSTVDAVPAILKALQGKGYALVTVPELYGSSEMRAGRLYTAGPLDRATR